MAADRVRWGGRAALPPMSCSCHGRRVWALVTGGRRMTALAIGVPRHWTFDAPVRLLLLLLVVGLAVAYLLLQRRRPSYEARFSDVDLLASVLPRRPGWRRHLPAAALLLALVAMTTAFARPRADVKVPRERATVVIALDVSGSMQATDVAPSRLTAAKAAAVRFVGSLPRTFDVGLCRLAAPRRCRSPRPRTTQVSRARLTR